MFAPDHVLRLSKDPLPLDTWPGGSEFGSGDPNLMIARRQRDRSRQIFDLRFRIEISRNECFHFEPVELDLQIELPPEAR